MVKANIGLLDKGLNLSKSTLEGILATEGVMEMKIRNYHWNIKGSHFNDIHVFLESMYSASAEAIDDIAERIRMLGFEVEGNYKTFLKHSLISEEEEIGLSREEMIQRLLKDKEAIIQDIRKKINILEENTNDMGTVDFLTELIQAHEKNAWMLRSMV